MSYAQNQDHCNVRPRLGQRRDHRLHDGALALAGLEVLELLEDVFGMLLRELGVGLAVAKLADPISNVDGSRARRPALA